MSIAMVKPHVGGIFSRGILVTRSALHLGMRASEMMRTLDAREREAVLELQRLTNAALRAAGREYREASRLGRTWRR